MTSNYRPDIDGLRAIAVLSVLIFHAGIKSVSGGYVGVDIFFVISGYLITSIIVREIENGNFSIVKFYERRFRRILPALTIVVISSLIVGSILFDASMFVDLGKSAVATTLFSSNILFYMESGYFDGPAHLKPLLHTWSLAVEEQYYIFFPIFLIIIARLDSKKYAKWLLPLCLLSFITCVVGMKFDSSGTFYLIPTRAWELLIGGALAINVLPQVKNQIVTNLFSGVGLLLIGFSIFSFSPSTNFPGIAAATPTLGAAMIIYSGIGGETFVGRILSFRPIVFIGLISYSLYLWHWPVLVYTKYYAIKELGNVEISVMIGMIFTLSILSWHYIEKPFRKKKSQYSRKSIFITSSTVSVIILSVGFLIIFENGFPSRCTNDLEHIIIADKTAWKHWESCGNAKSRINNNQELCNLGKDGIQPDFIFWGDSHAQALAPAIDLSAKRIGLTGKLATQSACPPLMSIERPNRLSCNEFNKDVLQYISDNADIKTVILAARWALSTSGTRYKKESGTPVKLIDIQSTSTADVSNTVLFEIGLKRTIDKLQELGKSVLLVKPVPEIGYDVPSAYFIATQTGRDVNSLISPTFKEYQLRTESVASIFSTLKNEKFVKIIDPSQYLCDEKKYCNVVADGILLYRDDDHLSNFGAKYVSPSFDSALAEVFNMEQQDNIVISNL